MSQILEWMELHNELKKIDKFSYEVLYSVHIIVFHDFYLYFSKTFGLWIEALYRARATDYLFQGQNVDRKIYSDFSLFCTTKRTEIPFYFFNEPKLFKNQTNFTQISAQMKTNLI